MTPGQMVKLIAGLKEQFDHITWIALLGIEQDFQGMQLQVQIMQLL